MVFSSLVFLFIFLPLFLGVYYLLCLLSSRTRGSGRSWAWCNLFLLAGSLLFYAWGEKLLVLVMLASCLIDYGCGLWMAGGFKGAGKALEKGGLRTAGQRAALVLSITANLGLLGVFKYFDFFIDNFNTAFCALGLEGMAVQDALEIALPMGISFYTFQSMSYTIDVYRGETAATSNFLNFTCFVTLFPQLIAGPIVRYRDLAAQLIERTVRLDGVAEGVRRFIVGLGKKVLIADVLAQTADRVYGLPAQDLTAGAAWLGTICFTLQLYFDFSGYSDMAIGLGRMLGFRFSENFNYPFISRSIREYWGRWHISLASWFRDYLYFPLGGSKVSPPRLLFNLFTVFFLCGLWHGASWTYVLWGLFHGFFLVLERGAFGRFIAKIPRPLQHLYLCGVNLGSKVLFRSASLGQAGALFAAMAGLGWGDPGLYGLGAFLDPELCLVLAAALIGCTPAVPWFRGKVVRAIQARGEARALWMEGLFLTGSTAALYGVLLLCILWMANVTYCPFIYFRF